MTTRCIRVVASFFTASALITTCPTLRAELYPNRNIQFMIPNVPGSTMDVTARTLGEDLGRILGTQIIPINKQGAGTTVGTDALAIAKKVGLIK
jgi:tripartite-type tricarboxylate transporter receptor subunit TctC